MYVLPHSGDVGVLMLLLLAGPGHFLEVEKMLPLLTAASPDHPSFHVVAPSLPNFGFSEAVKKPGFTGAKYAEASRIFYYRIDASRTLS